MQAAIVLVYSVSVSENVLPGHWVGRGAQPRVRWSFLTSSPARLLLCLSNVKTGEAQAGDVSPRLGRVSATDQSRSPWLVHQTLTEGSEALTYSRQRLCCPGYHMSAESISVASTVP